MPSPRKPKTAKVTTEAAKVETPKAQPQTELAAWFKQMSLFAEAGIVRGFVACAIVDGSGPITCVNDPNDSMERMALAGSVNQLTHMLNHTEYQQRMASLAARPDVTPPQA